jgi:hypothetical protein
MLACFVLLLLYLKPLKPHLPTPTVVVVLLVVLLLLLLLLLLRPRHSSLLRAPNTSLHSLLMFEK